MTWKKRHCHHVWAALCPDRTVNDVSHGHKSLKRNAVFTIMIMPRLGLLRILPRDAMHKRGLCRRAVSVCPSFRLSMPCSCILWKRIRYLQILQLFSPPGSHSVVVFQYQTLRQYSDRDPPCKGVTMPTNIFAV